jgi:hypothetical protein
MSTDPRVTAAQHVIENVSESFSENATTFTCTEAEYIAELYRAFGYSPDDFLKYHAEGDDEGDMHNPDGTLRDDS